ncbi:pentapeptide repeat-containing protein [Paenibacillus sp. IITD108]|uniref:pentapeptide repeat-containing protein n=1 Tax=Paenibacillus sp. IITD108 TaxID=3116649 RepID=UPI002F3F7CF6
MSNSLIEERYRGDCEKCFGLCCAALPFAKSADFAVNKDAGTPCTNLQADYRCGIHRDLRNKGFRGCTVYDCFGAGQQVSQYTYSGKDWRQNPHLAKEMFDVLPVMQQLYEMLAYLSEALQLEDTKSIHEQLFKAKQDIEQLTNQEPQLLLELDVSKHRAYVNDLFIQASRLVRSKVKGNKENNKLNKVLKRRDHIGARLSGIDLRGADLRGFLFIAADLRGADLRYADVIGADFRDADLSGANLNGCIFLTQAQVNSAAGDKQTSLPPSVEMPEHWNRKA